MRRTRGRSSSTATFTTRGLVLRRVDYAEADLVVTFMTQARGRVSAIARGARRSRRRFSGVLEPMHTLRLELVDRGVELLTLSEAHLDQPRRTLQASYERLQAAGQALRWVRSAAPLDAPEPSIWATLVTLLDRLDDVAAQAPPELYLAEAGLQLLAGLGWGLNLRECVRCSKRCDKGQSAMLSTRHGGLICRSCGGARILLEADLRERLLRAAEGHPEALDPRDVGLALRLVEEVLKYHGGVD